MALNSKGMKTPGSGRAPGTPNRRTLARQQQDTIAIERVAEALGVEFIEYVDPADFLQVMMQDTTLDIVIRGQIAKDLMPYWHPRKAAVAVDQKKPLDLSGLDVQQQDALLAELNKIVLDHDPESPEDAP